MQVNNMSARVIDTYESGESCPDEDCVDDTAFMDQGKGVREQASAMATSVANPAAQ